jgi:hypothetical protein
MKINEEENRKEQETKFIEKVEETQYLSDLLEEYFPQAL